MGTIYILRNQIKKTIFKLFVIFFIISLNNFSYSEIKNFKIEADELNSIVKNNIKDIYSFSGLASFYNEVSVFIADDLEVKKVKDNKLYKLSPEQSLVFVGHHKILILNNIRNKFFFNEEKINWQETDNLNQEINAKKTQAKLLMKSDLDSLPEPFQEIKYIHLWKPLKILCIYTELILIWINSFHHFGWGISIILLSLFYKILMFPINFFSIISQRKVSYIQASLAPELKKIKLNFSGEEAHQKFMKAHKERGVTPYYNLRPVFLTVLPIPFLIAIFNVLGEIDLILGHHFLWIRDLAYPDSFYFYGIKLPVFGNSINLLPILMTTLSILGAFFFKIK